MGAQLVCGGFLTNWNTSCGVQWPRIREFLLEEWEEYGGVFGNWEKGVGDLKIWDLWGSEGSEWVKGNDFRRVIF